ncbi:hypothetical protein L828_2642 [Mycobacteroides abscessus MAB_030201_1061]|nr:hypothetical protein L828_2642 [Mycobacteroides abscessus MAB_030201_1061]
MPSQTVNWRVLVLMVAVEVLMVAVEVGGREGGHGRSLVNRTVLLLTPDDRLACPEHMRVIA